MPAAVLPVGVARVARAALACLPVGVACAALAWAEVVSRSEQPSVSEVAEGTPTSEVAT